MYVTTRLTTLANLPPSVEGNFLQKVRICFEKGAANRTTIAIRIR